MGAGPHPILDVLRDPSIPLARRRARGLREGIPESALDRFVDDLPGDDGLYPTVEPGRSLADGEQLETRAGPWQVVSIPGHSRDQVALWNARHRQLISADLALPGPASYLEYGTRPDPYADQLESLERGIALEPDVILAGHGRPMTDAAVFLSRCRKKALARVSAVEQALGTTPVSGWEVAAYMTPPTADAGHWQRSLAESLSVLEHLEGRGRVRSTYDDDGIRRWLARGS
jgi:glyoxylase-like metal-dependent hydrolase (beta-lactamase superfamily II)